MDTYRFCDNVWTFMLSDVEFKETQEMAKVDKLKIVACDGKSKYFAFYFNTAFLYFIVFGYVMMLASLIFHALLVCSLLNCCIIFVYCYKCIDFIG